MPFAHAVPRTGVPPTGMPPTGMPSLPRLRFVTVPASQGTAQTSMTWGSLATQACAGLVCRDGLGTSHPLTGAAGLGGRTPEA